MMSRNHPVVTMKKSASSSSLISSVMPSANSPRLFLSFPTKGMMPASASVVIDYNPETVDALLHEARMVQNEDDNKVKDDVIERLMHCVMWHVSDYDRLLNSPPALDKDAMDWFEAKKGIEGIISKTDKSTPTMYALLDSISKTIESTRINMENALQL